MACTSLATVAENGIVCLVGIELVQESDARCYSAVQQRALVILLLDHIQHPHQRGPVPCQGKVTKWHLATKEKVCEHAHTSDVYWEKLVVYFPAMGITLVQL